MPSTNKGAGVPRNPQTDFTEMGIHNKMYCPRVCGRARIHALNTVLYIDSTQHLQYTDDPIASAAQKERLLSVGRKSEAPQDADDRRPVYL
jgi:hypothetical protein